MAEGHERAEGDFCMICFLPIEHPVGQHSKMKVCCRKRVRNGCIIWRHASGVLTISAPSAGHFCLTTMLLILRWFRDVSTRETRKQLKLLLTSFSMVVLDWQRMHLGRWNCGRRLQSWDQSRRTTNLAIATTSVLV